VNLRGLDGALVLLDGHRTAGYSDYNMVPLIAVNRVEVVKDGASSVYGADALAGVFNTILFSSYKGAKLDFYYGNTTDKDAGVIRAGVLAGGAVGKFDMVVAAEYYERNGLSSADRDVSKDSDARSRGGLNLGNPSFSGRTTARTSAGGPVQDLVLKPGLSVGNSASDFIPFDTNSTTSNQFLNFRQYTPTIPPANRKSFYGRANYSFTENIQAYAALLYTHSTFYNGLAPAPMPTTGSAGTALRNAVRSSPDIPTGLIVSGTSSDTSQGGLQIGSSPFRTVALGNRFQNFVRDAYDFTTGLKGRFAQDWSWDIKYVYSQAYRDDKQGGAPSLNKLAAAIINGSYNPFALDTASGISPVSGIAYNNPAALQAADAEAQTDREADTRTGTAKVVGPIWELPSGKVELAVGVDYRRDDQSISPNPIFFTGDLLGLNSNAPSISRAFDRGAFAEIILPVTSPAMSIPALRSLSLTASARRDFQKVEGYSGGASGQPLRKTFTSTSPRLGLRYQPVEEVLLRGTWGKGFRLPTLSQLFAAPSQGVLALTDPLLFPVLNQTPVTSQGNPNLDPEKSKTWSAGVVYSPKAVSGLSVTVDYYAGEISGMVVDGSQYILNTNAAGQGPGFVKGDASTINPNAPYASRITRSANGTISSVLSTPLNVSRRKTTGLDYSVTYEWPWKAEGVWTTSVDWNTVLSYDVTPIQGVPSQNWLGRFVDPSVNGISPGSIPRHHGNVSQGWRSGGWTAVATINYISHLEDDYNRTLNRVPRYISSWTTLDAQVGYTFNTGWPHVGGTTVRLGASNLTDVAAPFAAGAANDSYDVTTHSTRGRFVYAELTQKF
jgi:iron complex outermembrane receptor protein